jgi:D-alanyl-D-alanine carboxypeptidase
MMLCVVSLQRGERMGRVALARILAVVVFVFAASANGVLARSMTSIVVDHATGRILSQTGADTVNYPASLTKMMTLYLLFEEMEAKRLGPRSALKVSARAAGMPPSKLGLRAGTTIKVEDAIHAIVVKSANDVAVVIGENIAGSEGKFAERMTRKARALGMSHTAFRNASGLPDSRQKTTARDMATLARRIISDFPGYYSYFSTEKFVYRGRTYRTHNYLVLTYDGMDGLKTGYIRASGYNLASSAVRGGRRIVGVVLGGRSSGSRNAEMARLLDAGFAKLGKEAVPLVAALPPIPAPREMLMPAEKPTVVASLEPMPEIGGDLPEEDRSWGVQVGAFRSRTAASEIAHKASALLPDLLGDGRIELPRSSKRRNKLYLSRVLGIERAAAYSACEALKRGHMDCMVLRVR